MWPEHQPLPSEWDACARVAVVRKKAGWTQKMLAEQSGLSQSQLANIEKGRRGLYFRVGWKICKALNVNPWYLATGDGPETPFVNFDPDAAAGKAIQESASFVAVCCRRLDERLKSLTCITLKSNHRDMKSEMQKLMEKVKRKASQAGAKAQLARELDVAPARISEWLRGEKEPGGEYTLRLLKWVES